MKIDWEEIFVFAFAIFVSAAVIGMWVQALQALSP